MWRPRLKRPHAGWTAVVVALTLVVGGSWEMNSRTVDPANISKSYDPASAPTMVQSVTAPIAAASASPASAAPTVRQPLVPPAQATGDELHKVQLALDGGASPEATRDAAQILSVCQGADAAAKAIFSLRDQGDAAWRMLEKRKEFDPARLIEASQDTQRRCQVFDAGMLARRGELLKRAYEGGVKEVALDYLIWLTGESKQKASPELLSKLQHESRQAAEDGNLDALMVFGTGANSTLGATPAQRQAYREALYRIETELLGSEMAKVGREARVEAERISGLVLPKLTAEQQRDADVLTERIVGTWRKQYGSKGS